MKTIVGPCVITVGFPFADDELCTKVLRRINALRGVSRASAAELTSPRAGTDIAFGVRVICQPEANTMRVRAQLKTIADEEGESYERRQRNVA